jgi:enoyl-CoA hydratase/carnithine racemase
MTELVTYRLDGPVATITMDDGRVNVFSTAMLSALHAAFDRAERDGAVVLLTGRPGCFSAGFDLNVLAGGSGSAAVREMVLLDATLAERILCFPTPVVAACTGHAFPAGAFLLLAADVRLGADGPYQLGYNEVRIGITVPWYAVELARHRLHPAHANRALVTGEMYAPREAVEAGFLDRVLAAADLHTAALDTATDLAKIDLAAHAATKRRVRAAALTAVRAAIDTEYDA